MSYAHVPVMWNELREFLTGAVAAGDGIIVDCTLGEGGHSEKMLAAFPGIKVIAFERDVEILAIARERLDPFGGRISFINDNFSSIARHLGDVAGRIAGFLYDFGISSYHFDNSGRGFSYQGDEPLDMRLDGGTGLSARDIVNTWTEIKLTEIIRTYGEERWARRIARYICRSRDMKPLETSQELAQLVLRAIPARFHVKNIHPATRVFQALRIAVNDELSAIETSLRDALGLVASGGRICAISFHSLEDRIVKNIFRRASKGCVCTEEQCLCRNDPLVKILTKKPVVPGDAEMASNRRARSAKLRVAEKI